MTAGNPPRSREPADGGTLDPFVEIARAFSDQGATDEEISRKALDLRRDSENTPPEVRRQRALDAMAAIQKAFQESRITEAELQAEGRRIRRQLVRERYGQPKRDPGTSAKDR